ncbi:MAG: hypothetical protein DWQ04_10150 [Chloroflexi bacterium]|nr:MAG: hypothetical protein DWQ04_10150 [Chloroflexota bacterium]
MTPCSECNSNEVYQYHKPVAAMGGYGPDLLPKLASGIFSGAKLLPVVCAECGYIRFYASKEARAKLRDSKHWVQV